MVRNLERDAKIENTGFPLSYKACRFTGPEPLDCRKDWILVRQIPTALSPHMPPQSLQREIKPLTRMIVYGLMGNIETFGELTRHWL